MVVFFYEVQYFENWEPANITVYASVDPHHDDRIQHFIEKESAIGGFKEYSQYDAIGLAGLVQKGEITAGELCEEAIERIEQLNPKLNAVVTSMYDIGRKAASHPVMEGPFAGVPFLLKNLMYAFAGVPMSSGSKAYKHFVPDYDSEMVKRYKQAGLVILGKTNTPEFGLMGVTEPELFGPCRNPWNTDHTPGGSLPAIAAFSA